MHKSQKSLDKPAIDNQNQDLFVNFTTWGMDSLWKNNMLSLINGNPANILDLSAGTGILSFSLAEKYPYSNIISMEKSHPLMKLAIEKQKSNNITNVKFVLANPEQPSQNLPAGYKADLVISSYFPLYIDSALFINDIQSVITPNSQILLHDLTFPTILFSPAYIAYFNVLENVFNYNPTLRQYADYKLYNMIKNTNWVRDFSTQFKNYGYSVKIYPQLFDVATILDITKNPNAKTMTHGIFPKY